MNDLKAERKDFIELPDVLNGVKTPAEWCGHRREEVRKMIEKYLFGKIPPRPERIFYETTRTTDVFGGIGIRRDVTIHFRNGDREHSAKVLWYLPKKGTDIPLIAGLNFKGNAGCTDEPDVELEPGEERGVQTHRWQIPMILSKGLSLIVSPRNHFFPDHEDGRKESIYTLWNEDRDLTPEARDFTAISAWAWGYSALLDLAETDPHIDRKRLWIHGHSRLGKTALWCAANDPRIAGVVSNDSGCCGASISRNKLDSAEHFKEIRKNFPYWFVREFDPFVGHENDFPLDMHFLTALAAPRPLLISSATEDLWSDPFNEYRNAKAVSAVYRLFGAEGIPDSAVFPGPDQGIFGDKVAYCLRAGIHDVTAKDWEFVLKFIEKESK